VHGSARRRRSKFKFRRPHGSKRRLRSRRRRRKQSVGLPASHGHEPLRNRRRPHPAARLLRTYSARRRRRNHSWRTDDQRTGRGCIEARSEHARLPDPRARLDRGNLDGDLRQERRTLRSNADGCLLRRHANGLRHGPGGDGALLLSERQYDLHRPRFLQRAVETLPGARRFRRALRDRA